MASCVCRSVQGAKVVAMCCVVRIEGGQGIVDGVGGKRAANVVVSGR